MNVNVNRRSLLLGGAAAATLTSPWITSAQAGGHLPDPQTVLDGISVKNYVREDYRNLYGINDEVMWDPSKDWIRTVDWEAVREAQAGKTVRFAIGAADQDSAAEGLVPFEKLSGIKVELVPIPDDSLYDKALAEFLSGNASFDAIQFFSPWMGDFAAPGFLAPLDDYAKKWGLATDDFYETFLMNYGYVNGVMYGIPFDCDIQMVHVRKKYVEQVLGGPIDRANSIPTYEELERIAKELHKVEPGVSGVGLICAPGFWGCWSWQHLAAQHGMMTFDENWEPAFNSDAGMAGLEQILRMAPYANEGFAGHGWPENRAAWLGGTLATNISWQDSATQGMRPDQSQIVDDFITIYEPRVPGGRWCPPNIAGSTSCVAASSQNPEGAFLMLAFLTTASIMAMNEANANGVAPGYRSVLNNDNLHKMSQGLKVWADSCEHAWCSPRVPGGYGIDQAIGNELNRAFIGQISAKEALSNAATAAREIMAQNGFYQGNDPVNYEDTLPGLYVGGGKALPV